MEYGRRLVVLLFLAGAILSSCATRTDLQRVEGKLDMLILDVNRSSLEEIFGNQASEISSRVDELNQAQRSRFEALQGTYERGSIALEDVREKMMVLVGGKDREVTTQNGIYIRDLRGKKYKAIANGACLSECERLTDEGIPDFILEREALRKYSWGVCSYDGERVVFPWDYTISSFAREIVEATARRTAQEFITMGGERRWNRPIYIQISPLDADRITLRSNDPEIEVNVLPTDGIIQEAMGDAGG